MFLGQYQLNLDENRRMALPASFRELLAGGAYVTRGFEQNLVIMSDQVFQEICKRIAGLNMADPLARLLLRLILGNASRLDVNESGNVALPKELSQVIGLDKELVLVGEGDYCEVWAPSGWEQQTNTLMDMAANAERFAGLDLALYRA
ncbi:MAG TPA: division/cell wall cluster transcriptional repressor MraZ [Anaerolineales bacterium]|nr:division/cell wall cluster transcriptional repressor MraZ [Anaerolineales bacterium]